MTNGDRTADNPFFLGRKAQMFPQLTAAQIARLEAHGTHRPTSRGEILNEPGDRNLPMLVVLSGSIDVIQSGMNGEALLVVHTAGSFTGEMSTLQGIGTLVAAAVGEGSACVQQVHLALQN
jgi:thioredoxin reductase (NADPH)